MEQLAQESGISKGFLSDVENGRSDPSGKVVLKLAGALDASVDHLLRGDAAAADVRVREIPVPVELLDLAEEQGWGVPKLRALMRARDAVQARRSDRRDRPFTKAQWLDLAERLKPFLDDDEG